MIKLKRKQSRLRDINPRQTLPSTIDEKINSLKVRNPVPKVSHLSTGGKIRDTGNEVGKYEDCIAKIRKYNMKMCNRNCHIVEYYTILH